MLRGDWELRHVLDWLPLPSAGLQDHLKAQDNDMLNVFNMIMLHAEQIQQLQGAVLSKGAP